MTEDSTAPLPVSQAARELLPCPFCREAMVVEHGMFGHDNSNTTCLLRHQSYALEQANVWNTRSGEREPAPSSERELLERVHQQLAEKGIVECGSLLACQISEWHAKPTSQEPAPDLHTLDLGALARALFEIDREDFVARHPSDTFIQWDDPAFAPSVRDNWFMKADRLVRALAQKGQGNNPASNSAPPYAARRG